MILSWHQYAVVSNIFTCLFITYCHEVTAMDSKLEANTLHSAKEIKLKELQAQEEKLKELQADLAKLNSKIKNHEELSAEDTKFVSELGWISALSVTIATIAASI
jgi:uncharacterized protein YlxW (UPF0749 family)